MAFIGERNKVLICSFLSISLQVALHACGVATDMVMEHCIQVGAAFVISPCCYGFIQNAIKFTFPRRFVTSHFTSPGVYKCCFNPCFLTFFSCNLFVSFLNVVVSWESHMSLSLRYTVYIFLSVLGFFFCGLLQISSLQRAWSTSVKSSSQQGQTLLHSMSALFSQQVLTFRWSQFWVLKSGKRI